MAINKILTHANLISDIRQDFKINRLKVLKELQLLLNFHKLPHLIEGYDISHLAGKDKVGIRVLFRDGEYDKNGLRRFRIKTILKPDDPKMIYEVLNRRLRHLEWELPDIILIDGGKIQFQEALKAVKENNLENSVKIISLAKPKGEIFYDPEKPPLKMASLPIYLRNFLKLINKKAHLAVLRYHRQLREKIK